MLKLTLSNGEVVEVDFYETSTITIVNTKVEEGRQVDVPYAFSEVVGIELVAGEVEKVEPADQVEEPVVETPAAETDAPVEAPAEAEAK